MTKTAAVGAIIIELHMETNGYDQDSGAPIVIATRSPSLHLSLEGVVDHEGAIKILRTVADKLENNDLETVVVK